MHNIREIVKNVDFFQCLTTEDLDMVVEKFQKINYKKDDIIFEEFTFGDNFFIIMEGEVAIFKHLTSTIDSKSAELDILRPYTYFGEMSLVDEFPRSASAKAYTDCTLLSLNKEAFIEICLSHPKVVFNLVKTVSNRLRTTNQKFVEIVDKLIKESRMVAIGTAASKIVHDIKTPITIIILTAELIASLYSETEDFTNKIVKQANALDELVREILDFARGEQSFLDLKECNLDELFDDIDSTVTPIAGIKKIELVLENDVDFPIVIDSGKIKRTIINIVKNAIEAIPDFSKIYINSEVKNQKWCLNIRDTGQGIPESMLANIFEPFVTKGKKHGTGLGLAICKKIIEDHNGVITAGNHQEGGAVFNIQIPVIRV